MKHVAMLCASILLMALVGCNAKKEKPQPLAEAHEEIVAKLSTVPCFFRLDISMRL